MLPYSQSYASWLAIVRIYAGIFWLLHGVPKVLSATWAGPSGDMAGIIRQVSASTAGPYHDFIVHVVLPNATTFSHLVAWGETLTGLSLLLGLVTRLGGLVGVFLPLNYFLLKGSYAHLPDYAGLDTATMALGFLNLVLPTGLVFGLDGRLARSRRRGKPAGKT